MRPLLLMLLLPLLMALDPPAGPDEGPRALIPPTYLSPALPLPERVLVDLTKRRHRGAAAGLSALDASDWTPEQRGQLAFLSAWSLLRAGDPEGASVHLEALEDVEGVPAHYLQLTRAELLLAAARPAEAALALSELPDHSVLSPRAQLVRADALREAGATAEARATYRALASREDPAEGSELALLALAGMAGWGSPESVAYLRRIWAIYPFTDAGREAARRLEGVGARPTIEDLSWRGDRTMLRGDYNGTIRLLGPRLSEVTEPSAAACRYWYAYGRSLFRVNRLTEAANVLGPAGERCVGHDDDRGPKALYLAGKAQERKKAWTAAATRYKRIAELYPDHSYADDGLTLAGIGRQEAGDLEGARAIWADQVRRYPEGDLAAEGYWRLAWGTWLSGDTPAAIAWAEEASARVPIAVDPEHVRAARYWAARWRAYPDPDRPAALTEDPEALGEAIAGWVAVCTEHPHSWYALLAAARLAELAPEALAEVPRPPPAPDSTGWVLRMAFLEDPQVRTAVELARLGLYKEALSELDALDPAALTPAEIAWITSVQWDSGDWLMAHDRLKGALRHLPPEIQGDQRERVLLQAHPQVYWDLTQRAVAPYDWDPRLFHALVREESNFNKGIVSHADAVGLSQLLPSTARGVGRWMGLTVSRQQLFDPATNLRIGARYLESLLNRYNGNPALALAGYNAGEGNVGRWMTERGDLPTDAWVESIPYRETRRYVKRVSRTWQTFHLLYDEGPTFIPLERFNHSAVPEG